MATTNGATNSTSAYSYLQYKNKVGGLISGMDIDSIMEKLMKAESAQMEKLQQQKQKYEWKRDAYRETNTKIDTFQKDLYDNYALKGSWNAKNVSVSNTAVTATATPAANGSLAITEAKLATAGQNIVTIKGKISELGLTPEEGTISYFVGNEGVKEEKTFTYTKEDTLESFATKLTDTGDFKAEVMTANDGTQSLKVTVLKDVEMIDEESFDFAESLGLGSGLDTIGKDKTVTKTTEAVTMGSLISPLTEGTESEKEDPSFTIGAINDKGEYIEKKITYKATDKLSDVVAKINSSGVGVTAIMSGNQLSITANTEGTGNKGSIYIAEDKNNLFANLGFEPDANGTIATGSTGHIVANGVKIEGTSNAYTISGYQVTVNKNITATDEPTKISSTTDTDKLVEKVKAFVTSYNDLIASLNTSVAQKKNVSYSPLTDAQKVEMTTDQITKWEEKAKEGLLKGDTTLNNVLSSMRSTLSTYGFGSADTLAKIGITTSATYTDNGKLEIDEDKLRAAIADDANIVTRIFTGDSATGAEGIVSKLRTAAQTAVKNIKNTAGSESSSSDVTYSLGKTITSLSTKIDDWKDRLKEIEERYWNQFSAMEKAVQKANNQSSIFAQ